MATVGIGAAAGSGATATLDSTATDERGIVTITAAGTPAAGLIATVTFQGSWQGYSLGVYPGVAALVTNALSNELGNVTCALNAYSLSLSIYCTGTPVAGHVYPIRYKIDG
jgi:hypothetical protein